MLHAVHTTASLHARNGGPPRTISALAEGLGRSGLRIDVVTVRDGEPLESIQPHPDAATVELVERGRGVTGRFKDTIVNARPDLVHDHGLWLPTNHAAAQAARQSAVPLAVTTRGMLEPWAREHRKVKKAIAWHLYQRRDLASAAVLHATADSEAESLREVGLRAPIAVIPNGVEVPTEQTRAGRPSDQPRRALFLSRVHPKKGLPLFLDVWAGVRPSGWELVIAGPDENGHQSDLEAQAARLGLSEVRFVGSVGDADKWDLYRSADLFVLPTYSENFGVVVAEALAVGVPVLTTTGTPWSDLRDHRCGWWVHPEAQPLADALRAATDMSEAERIDMGARGRVHVASTYGWSEIAAQMAEVYEWILGRASALPSTIHVD